MKTLEERVNELEKKMDKLLNGELSTSFELDFKNTTKAVNAQLDQMFEDRQRKARISR